MFTVVRQDSPMAVTLLERHPKPREIIGTEHEPGDFYLFASDPPPDVRVVKLNDASHLGIRDAFDSLYTDQALCLTVGQVRELIPPSMLDNDLS